MRNLLIIAFMCISSVCKAQFIGSLINEEQERARISLVDEFMKRFNGLQDRPDITKSVEDYETKRLLALFNGKQFKSINDSTLKEAFEFIDEIQKDSTHINYTDTTWIAKVDCHGLFKKKNVTFTLYMSVENRKDDMYKWVINKAEGEIFRLLPSSISDDVFISPDAHETKFMGLKHITTGKDDYISRYLKRDKRIDLTSVFLSYVYNGLLEIDYIEDVEFIFFQVPNYIFTIKEFNRESFNDGWLISSFQKLAEDEKTLIYNNLKR